MVIPHKYAWFIKTFPANLYNPISGGFVGLLVCLCVYAVTTASVPERRTWGEFVVLLIFGVGIGSGVGIKGPFSGSAIGVCVGIFTGFLNVISRKHGGGQVDTPILDGFIMLSGVIVGGGCGTAVGSAVGFVLSFTRNVVSALAVVIITTSIALWWYWDESRYLDPPPVTVMIRLGTRDDYVCIAKSGGDIHGNIRVSLQFHKKDTSEAIRDTYDFRLSLGEVRSNEVAMSRRYELYILDQIGYDDGTKKGLLRLSACKVK